MLARTGLVNAGLVKTVVVQEELTSIRVLKTGILKA
jgi:hypothetical protein